MRIFTGVLRSGVSLAALAALAVAAPGRAQDASDMGRSSDDTQIGPEIIVTGVFSAKSIENAPISVSAVTSEEINQQVPASAADLIKNVPGVFVNSSLGEIRNVVFSRGVSANSLDGDGGYFYVSMQENGLPVEPVTSGNFGPDYFSRPDIMLDRLEALRGGTATVTSSNAPGGVFNYISRTGKSHPGVELRAKFGLEGDGRNPYYRADAYFGGEIANGLYGAIGGFYRRSDGARDPGYALNEGGQVRANLLWDYGSGTLRVDGKYLDDHNGWFEFLPAFGYSDPNLASPFTTYDSVLPPSNPHDFTNPDGSTGHWDGSNLVHAKARSIGLTWNQEVSDSFRVENRVRYSHNSTHWNTGAVIFPVPLDDFFLSILTGTIGLPGTTTYSFRGTNSVAAQVTSFSGFDHTVTVNNLPNQNVLENGILTEVALDQAFSSKSFQDQFTASWDIGSHQLAAGVSYAFTRFKQRFGSAGLGIATLEGNPQIFDITHTLPDGTVLQITDPTGFARQGAGLFDGDGYGGKQDQLAFYFGDNWQITEKLSVDLGVRHESIGYTVYNLTLAGSAPVNGGGGFDGNPLTWWDNFANVASGRTHTRRTFDYWNYTGALNYMFSDSFQAYVRYTDGRKAPDFGLIQGIDTPDEIANVFPEPQRIQQAELGLKYNSPGIRLAVFPFYSKLSNVGTTQLFTDAGGQLYTPPPVFGQIETYGVEIDGDIDIMPRLNLRTALTFQEPKASKFAAWVANDPGPDDDELVATPSGDADNNPKILTRTTLTWTPVDEAQVFLTHSYTGKRAANRENAFYLPGFHTFDLGASYDFGGRFQIQANVNNLFNNFGIMSWARTGGFLASLDRQGLTKAAVAADPNGLLAVVPIPPRSFWITGTVKF